MIREIDELGRSVSTMRTVMRDILRFVPRRLVEQLIESGTPMQLGGTRREITVFFSDIVDFTADTEKADPARGHGVYVAILCRDVARDHDACRHRR